uniref:Uncharacterized protein n=1 Tax=Opuntia streptacantha TaxID=393608 RepID=A0A7C8YE10_OPUST
MPIAVNVRMQRCWRYKYNLRSFHRIMLRKINLKLIGFVSIQSPRCASNFDHPSLKIISDFEFESSRRIDLPLQQLLLEPILGDLAQSLARLSRGAGHGFWKGEGRMSWECSLVSHRRRVKGEVGIKIFSP